MVLTSRTAITPITSHDQCPAALAMAFVQLVLFEMSLLFSLALNESTDCNISTGATQSSVKSSHCVTDFPVQGGTAIDCVPLLRMWFSGLKQYEQRELVSGSLVVDLSLAQPPGWFGGERHQTARLKFFT